MRTRHHLDKRSLSPLASLFHRAAALLSALLVAACGNSNWLEVRFVGEDENGPVDETVRLTGASVFGDIESDRFSTGSGQGAYFAYFSTADTSTHLGEKPLMMLTLGRRIVDPELWHSTGTSGFHSRSDFHGMSGPGLTAASLFHGVSKEYRIGAVDIDRWRYTGDPKAPLEISGKSVFAPDPIRQGVMAEVSFSFRPNCRNLTVGTSTLCGAAIAVKEPRTYRAGHLEQSPECPDEVLRPFLGDDFQDKDVEWGLSYVKVEGASQQLSCTLTQDSEVARMCGAELEVQADGCKWKVDVVSSLDQHGVYYHIGARTEPECRKPVHFCNALFRGLHQ